MWEGNREGNRVKSRNLGEIEFIFWRLGTPMLSGDDLARLIVISAKPRLR